MRRGRKWFIILACAIVVTLVSGTFGFIFSYVSLGPPWLQAMLLVVGMDEGPPDDSNLVLVRPEIPDAQNGFTYTRQAAESLLWPGYRPPGRKGEDASGGDEPSPDAENERLLNQMIEGETWDAAVVAQVLDANKPTLALLDKAMACPEFQVPEPEGLEADMSYREWFVALAGLACLRTRASMQTGDQERALDEAIAVIRFGHRIECAKGVVVTWLVGRTVKGLGLAVFDKSVAECTLPPDRLMGWAKQLNGAWPDDEGLCDTCRAEYEFTVGIVDDFRRGPSSLEKIPGITAAEKQQAWSYWLHRGWIFRPNETRRLFGDVHQEVIRNVPRPFASMQLRKPPVHHKWREYGVVRQLLAGNIIGRRLHVILATDGHRLLVLKSAGKTGLAFTKTLLAMKIFRMTTGRLPDTLDELVPEYIDAVPLDDFDGKPIRYSPEKKILYSVGEDLKDDGGFTKEEACAWAKEHLSLEEGEDPLPWDLPGPSVPIGF